MIHMCMQPRLALNSLQPSCLKNAESHIKSQNCFKVSQNNVLEIAVCFLSMSLCVCVCVFLFACLSVSGRVLTYHASTKKIKKEGRKGGREEGRIENQASRLKERFPK